MPEQPREMDASMSVDELYLEEVFTDRRVGTIQRLTPVTPGGDPDPARPVLYVGQTQILTPGGALPLSFDIPASSLEEAVQDTMQRLQELRREAASSLIVPGSGGGQGMGGMGAGGMPGGGLPGGGKIRMP